MALTYMRLALCVELGKNWFFYTMSDLGYGLGGIDPVNTYYLMKSNQILRDPEMQYMNVIFSQGFRA
jgi:hypothetical protein